MGAVVRLIFPSCRGVNKHPRHQHEPFCIYLWGSCVLNNSAKLMFEDFLWLCLAFAGLILVFACICVVVDGHLVPGTFH
jgi:hypothetical protein